MLNTASIAKDLDLCDMGIVMTSGKLRKAYVAHRKACFAAVKEANKTDGLDKMTDDELMAALLS